MKFLILGVLFYFLYRLIVSPPAIKDGTGKVKINDVKDKPGKNEAGEFIDYEEIE